MLHTVELRRNAWQLPLQLRNFLIFFWTCVRCSGLAQVYYLPEKFSSFWDQKHLPLRILSGTGHMVVRFDPPPFGIPFGVETQQTPKVKTMTIFASLHRAVESPECSQGSTSEGSSGNMWSSTAGRSAVLVERICWINFCPRDASFLFNTFMPSLSLTGSYSNPLPSKVKRNGSDPLTSLNKFERKLWLNDQNNKKLWFNDQKGTSGREKYPESQSIYLYLNYEWSWTIDNTCYHQHPSVSAA